MLVAVVCREKKEVSNEIALFFTSLVALLMVLVFASGCSNRATATTSPGADLNRLKTFDEAVGRPQIPNAAFEQALATSIRRSEIFSKVIGDQTEAEDFILVVTLSSIDERLFGHTFG
jgi:hypothetical protein